MNIPRRLHFIVATLITIGILALIGAGVVFYTKSQLTSELIERYLQQQNIIGLQVSQTAQTNFEAGRNFIGTIATFPEIQNGTSTACARKLKELSRFIPENADEISRINTSGFVTCSTEPRIVGLNVKIFDNAIKEILDDADHKPAIGGLSIPPGASEPAIGFYFPLRDEEGTFIGVIRIETAVSSIRARYENNPAFPIAGEPILADHEGNILYSTDAAILNLNVYADDVPSRLIEKNTLQHILRLSERNKSGNLAYELWGREYLATYRNIELVPGHSWTLIFAIAKEQIQETFLSNVLIYMKLVMGANVLVTLIVLTLFIWYITRKLIRPEALISKKHNKHMKKDLSEITNAFGQVTKKLGKLEQHLEHDMNALHNKADKDELKKSGKGS